MEITGYVSEITEDLLRSDKRFKLERSKGIIPLCNSKVVLEELFEDMSFFKFLEDINTDTEYFLFDIFNEIEDIIRFKGVYLLQSTFNNLKTNTKYKKMIRQEVSIDLFKEAYRAFCNKIIRTTHVKKIILLRYKIIEDSYDINNVLEEYYREIEIMTPGIQTIDIELVYEDSNYKIRGNSGVVITNILKKCGRKDIFKDEKIHNGIMPIKYYFEKASLKNRDKLIIIFSAFSTDEAKYNYVTALKAIDCNKLFILDDYGTKGTYYIGLDGQFDIETSVMSLISKIMMEYNITFKNIISVGSSKGGSAALYYGLKYNFSNIIAGAPQYRIGTYLCDLSIKDYGKDTFGEISDGNRIKYDSLIRNNINSNKGKIRILTSDGDNQYKRVLKDFQYLAEELNLNLDVDKCQIENHGEIAKVFPQYLVNNLNSILEKNIINDSIYKSKWIKVYKCLYKKYIRR